jgi:hypothetical protein
MKDRKPLLLLVFAVLIILLIGIFRPREIDWTPTFAAADKIPYGSYILYNSLPQLFSDKKVVYSNKQPYDWQNEGKQKSSFCFIQYDFNPSSSNVNTLLYLAATGNDVFISAPYLSGAFADTLRLKQTANYDVTEVMKTFGTDTQACVNTNFTNAQLHTDSGYWQHRLTPNYFYNLTDSAFIAQGFLTGSDAKHVTILGTDGSGHPNFIAINYGAGRLLLHNNPFAFSNYYMLKPENADYAAKCFSYLQGDEIIWNEYYKQQDSASDQSPLRFILAHEPLRWAYYILMGSLGIFVLFNIKRKQRIIPVADPYKNNSLEFARLVGALYYNQSDHKNIMVKKINYLFEFIRNRYNLDTNEINAEFIHKLVAKSGLEPERINYLLDLIKSTQKKNWLSKHELVDLNNAIQYFKTHCN